MENFFINFDNISEKNHIFSSFNMNIDEIDKSFHKIPNNKRLIKLYHEDLSFYKNIPKDKIE